MQQNHGLNPLEKCQFFDCLNFLFLQPRKLFFSFQNIMEHIFLAYTSLKEKRMANYATKPWTKPFGKMSIFRLLELLVFIAQKVVFWFSNIIQHIFLSYTALKKKKKWLILQQNHGLNPLKKCQFFNFLNFLFLQPRKLFFGSRILYNTFSFPILP